MCMLLSVREGRQVMGGALVKVIVPRVTCCRVSLWGAVSGLAVRCVGSDA
jgi:hypothetical protein